MYDAVLEIAYMVWKNGLSLSALGTALYVLLKQRKVKRVMRRMIPWLLEDDSEVKTYVANQLVIMENQRRMMAALGVDPVCPDTIAVTSIASNGWAVALKTFFISSWAARLFARAAAVPGIPYITSSNITKARMNKMKKWFRPDALTVLGGVLAAATTRYFGIDIDPANILAAAILLAGYFKANEFVTVVRDANGLPTGFKLNSRKLIFTAVAFGLVVADIAFKLNLGNELILSITAAVTGFNYAEAKKDAKEAEQEGAAANQSY